MLIRLVVIALVLGCMVHGTHAEIIEIPILDFVGTYAPPGIRFVMVDLDQTPVMVHHVWIRGKGETVGGVIKCNDTEYPNGAKFGLTIHNYYPGSGFWNAWLIPENGMGSFDLQAEFEPHSGATWEFLIASSPFQLTVVLYPDNYADPCFLAIDPSGILEHIYLVIEADFVTPTRHETWGRIKALY